MHAAKPSRHAVTRSRRGNTIVLVTAILVLLVIIATAFVGRTRAVRQISAAQLSSAGRDSRAESIGVNVAQEISDALFARPLDGFFNPTLGGIGAPDLNDPYKRVFIPTVGGLPSTNPELRPVVVASSSWPRLAPFLDAQRYSIDRDVLSPVPNPNNVTPGDGIPDFGYNFAPYDTKPWTNWPDQFDPTSPWPYGPGAPGGVLNLADGNPYGNPGTGDSRWLRSTEPVRIGLDQSGDGTQDIFTFSHWQHLSWLPSASNSWRVVADISNIVGGTLENMNENDATRPFAVAIPYEQWLPNVLPSYPALNLSNPTSVTNFNNDFTQKRNQWFAAFNQPQTYLTNYRDASRVLPNFFRLRDLGTPRDEFKSGTPRNTVARTFTDTDGDGFTDSFWFVGPANTDRAVRTIVGVSIVDNSALLNANVATKFSFGYDADATVNLSAPIPGTIGQTPADLALVTSVAEFPPFYGQGNTVGFLDGPVNQPSTNVEGGFPIPTYWSGNPTAELAFPNGLPRYDRERFGDTVNIVGWQNRPSTYLQAIGLRGPTGGADRGEPDIGFNLYDDALQGSLRGLFESPKERLAYFKMAGLDPERPLFGVTPFDTSDEFELRAYHGNNLPYTLSRFEQAMSLYSPPIDPEEANDFQFLRASPMREESSEALDQLTARQLLVDNRRKLTLFNGARNETIPPWLWTTPYYDETFNYMNPRTSVPLPTDPAYANFQTANREEYERQKFKVDLRAPMFVRDNGDAQLTRNPLAAFQWRRDMQQLLTNTLARQVGTSVESYFGTRPGDYDRTLSMIASYVANLECASDEPLPFGTSGTGFDNPLYPSAPSTDPSGFFPPTTDAVIDPTDSDRFYLGMEKQPYIVEVFFGLVYPASQMDEDLWESEGGLASEISDPFEIPDVATAGGSRFVDSSSKPTAIIAVQIANPYDTPIPLAQFQLEWFGRQFQFPAAGGAYGLNPTLPPATLGRPSTAIVYAVTGDAFGSYTAGALRDRVLDFFDLEIGEMSGSSLQATDVDGDGVIERACLYDSRGTLPDADPVDRTLVFDATGAWLVNDVDAPGSPVASNARYRSATESVRLLRRINPPANVSGPIRQVAVDRFENDETGPRVDFIDSVKRLFEDPELFPPEQNYRYSNSRKSVNCIRLEDNDFYATWTRASRIWALDVSTWTNSAQAGDPRISAEELSPRYVFSVATTPARPTRGVKGVRGTNDDVNYTGEIWRRDTDPDTNVISLGIASPRWPRFNCVDIFGERLLRTKPVFFSNIVAWPENAPPGPVDVVYEVTTNGSPIPFLPNQMDPYPEAQRGVTEFLGVNYQWQIGGKGVQSLGADPADITQAEWRDLAAIDALAIPFQVNQRDADFDQVGEILDVFLWGHVFENWTTPVTVRTFSEILVDDDEDSEFYPGTGPFLNRLQIGGPDETVIGRRFVENATTGALEPLPGYRPWRPALPIGVAILDGLTVDGPGRNTFDRNVNSRLSYGLFPTGAALFEVNPLDPDAVGPTNPIVEPAASPTALLDLARAEERQLRLANAYRGLKTPGLVNINTALPEVMQALPMMTRVPKNDPQDPTEPIRSPYSHLVDMIRSYREGVAIWAVQPNGVTFGAPSPVVNAEVPAYIDRGLTPRQYFGNPPPPDEPTFFPGMRNEQGFSSIGELTLLRRTPDPAVVAPHLANAYSVLWLGLDPYQDIDGDFNAFDLGYSWGTDRTRGRPRQLPEDIFTAVVTDPALLGVPFKQLDEPLGDAEDLNLLFKGISNLVTTRSDVFTVYLRVRQVRQNPVNGIWDGTNPEFIVDDSRYVMCVDRSEVNVPSDQPKILFFQKCPN